MKQSASASATKCNSELNSMPGLLMRPEHSETKAKTETRECETETETETKKLLWDRDRKYVKVKQIGMLYYLVSIIYFKY